MKYMVALLFFVVGIINYIDAMTSSQNLLFSLTTTSTWREFKPTLAQQKSPNENDSKIELGRLNKSHAPITSPKLKSAIAGKKKDKWVLVGEIKLKTKNTLFIKDLKARWRGGNLGNTFASLYSKKLTDRRLPVPIEENLICDGTWNPTTKEFVFPVNKKLVASDTYYLMLNVPAQYETRLRTGSFEIIQHKKRALLHLKK